ncbi:methyltransferase domain-containing protein [Pseudomonas sp. S36]|uniref:methyltransferase domain-containing protein n=1 Tax=Pseudomonas sp. S36 TaxID=2767447 RepID=UPI001911C218|nr:methyltransferase domain-containing protein [Pseudomonas sp. S36]MBK4990349.1 methyltransferase domain-containing protein [Pseudomonas sp. S36]
MDYTQQRREASEAARKIGDQLFNKQQLSLAATAYNKSLDLDNKNIKTLNNLGVLYEKLGETEKSIELYRRACSQLKDKTINDHTYYGNLARACHSIKETRLGLWAYEKTIEAESTTTYETAVNYLDLLSNTDAASGNRQTLSTLEKISNIEKIDHELLLYIYYKNIVTSSTIDITQPHWPSQLVKHLSKHKLAFKFLTKHIITNPVLENLLERSKKHLPDLDKKHKAWLSAVIDSQHLLSQHAFNSDGSEIRQIISGSQSSSKIFIRKPRRQNNSLNKLTHATSRDPLRSFYESNPYPKWRYLPHHSPSTIDNYFAQTGLTNTNSPSLKIKILVAGCGTGRHAIQVALNYPDAQIIGIDISFPSLQYANIMKQKHNVDNVTFIHSSIFDVTDLKIKFHIIECIGVLHHLRQPCRAIKSLLMVLRKNGILKLGLYSKVARAPIDTLKKKCIMHKIAYSPNNILEIRRLAITQSSDEFESILWSRDFYSHQGCMDLLFNPHEYNYTPKRIYDLLRTHNLDFCGFDNHFTCAPAYTKFNSGKEPRELLRKWQAFESLNPTAFSNMYLFWVKPRNTHENRKL